MDLMEGFSFRTVASVIVLATAVLFRMSTLLSDGELETGIHDVDVVQLEELFPLPLVKGAESFVQIPNGKIYSGLPDGSVVELTPGTWNVETVLPRDQEKPRMFLGMAYNPMTPDNGTELFACDGHGSFGLVDIQKKTYTILLTEVDGIPIAMCNAVAVTPNGVVIFTHSSAKYSWPLEFVESVHGGRLISYDIRTGAASTLVAGINFANGVILRNDGKSIIYAEMAERRLMEVKSANENESIEDAILQRSPLTTNVFKQLQWFVDNLKINPVDTRIVLLGLPGVYTPFPMKLLERAPWLRQVLMLLPSALINKMATMLKIPSAVLSVDTYSGQLLRLYHDKSGRIFYASEGFIVQGGKHILIGTFNPNQAVFVARLN